jgi:hypothetical protein
MQDSPTPTATQIHKIHHQASSGVDNNGGYAGCNAPQRTPPDVEPTLRRRPRPPHTGQGGVATTGEPPRRRTYRAALARQPRGAGSRWSAAALMGAPSRSTRTTEATEATEAGPSPRTKESRTRHRAVGVSHGRWQRERSVKLPSLIQCIDRRDAGNHSFEQAHA